MRRFIARKLNANGNYEAANGHYARAMKLYNWASRLDPTWSEPLFNLGLSTKYAGQWQESLRFNQRATELNNQDEGAWWNLGIAATALHDWNTARAAWRHLNIEVPEGDGEWNVSGVAACVRINPSGDGEVVWGERLDPARIRILSVPLPESGHRFKDIVLNDGAANGHRTLNGTEVPVFDELEIWRPSSYSTYEVTFQADDPALSATLERIAKESDLGIGIEDWSTIRWICAECSRGNPGPHECNAKTSGGQTQRFAIAAESESDVKAAIAEITQTIGAKCLSIELVTAA
jgi:tetratricopeptide (TPR) repeat protein